MLTTVISNPFATPHSNGGKINSLGGKIGLGGPEKCARSFRGRNKWHLRGSIYRLIWISRTSDAFLPLLLSLLSWLSFSLSHPCVPYLRLSYIRHLHRSRSSIHPLVVHEGCFRLRSPTSLHSTLNVSWWKSLLCRRFLSLAASQFFRKAWFLL